MKNSNTCPKCKSKNIKRVSGENQSKIGVPTGMLSWAAVSRYVCLDCGYIEEYIDSKEALKKLAK